MNSVISVGTFPGWHTLAGFRRACVFFSSLVLCVSLSGNAQKDRVDPGLTAHEWGTFTTVAGETGQAVEWLPLNGPTDLPSFVEHFRGTGFKVGLGGTIRMETPVLYFYSTHDTTVDVHVSFVHGLITEWYPHCAFHGGFPAPGLHKERRTARAIPVLPRSFDRFIAAFGGRNVQRPD